MRQAVHERSSSLLNRAQYPSGIIALVVLWRLRYRLTLRDLAGMFLIRGIVFSYDAAREWEAKLAPPLADELRRRPYGKGGSRSRLRRCWQVGARVEIRLPRISALSSFEDGAPGVSVWDGTGDEHGFCNALAMMNICPSFPCCPERGAVAWPWHPDDVG